MGTGVSIIRIRERFVKAGWLLGIPILWCVCAAYDGLTSFEQKFVDWRFGFGESSTPR